jgi:DNA-binding transcriptional ArsR family regulator
MSDDELDTLLRALGDATRRRLLDRLRDTPGLTLSALSEGFEQSRQAISKHLAQLAAADLVVCVWRGREKLHYLNPAPIHEIGDRWISKYERTRLDALFDLKKALESDNE